MELLSALSHAIELFIVFQFFNDLFANKGRKTVAAAVGIAFYAVAYAAFLLFNSTVFNILLCFVIDSVFAKLFFECNIKGATLGALFIAVSNTASEFIVMSVLGIVGGDIKTYRSSLYIYLLMVLLSKSVLFVLTKAAVYAGLYLRGQKGVRIPAFLLIYPNSVDSYPLYFLDDFRALRFVEEYKCYNFRRVNRYNRIGVSDFRLLRAHFAQDGRAL